MDLISIMDKIMVSNDRPFKNLTDSELQSLFDLWKRRKGHSYRITQVVMEQLKRTWNNENISK